MTETTKSSPSDPNKPETQPLDRIGFLAAGIVHNLFGPLTAMMGTVDILKMKHPELSKELERLDRLNKRLKEDISYIMVKARMDGSGEVVEINLADLIENELNFYKGDPRIKHMIETDLNFADNIPLFRAPYRDFSIALDHILSNAVEAMIDVDPMKLDISLVHDNDNISLGIKDNGCGMDDDTLKHAFDAFFSTKKPVIEGKNPATRATGIGLTHALALLEPHGCKIELNSQPGNGTEVKILIPFKRINEVNSE